MTRVSKVNDLYDANELAHVARKHGKLGAWKPRTTNTPDSLALKHEHFAPVEETIALGKLQNVSKLQLAALILKGLRTRGFFDELQRLGPIPSLERAALLGALA